MANNLQIKVASLQWIMTLEVNNNDYITIKGYYENCDPTKPVIAQITFNDSFWSWEQFQKLAPVMYYTEEEGNDLIKQIKEYVISLI